MIKTFERINILGVQFHKLTHTEAVKQILAFMEEQKKASVFTPNPEIVIEAYKDTKLRDILNESPMVIADGIGIIYGSRIIRKPLPMRVAGYDVLQSLFEQMAHMDLKVFFYGSGPGVAEKAKEAMEAKYPGLKIVGTLHGYHKDQDMVLSTIKKAQADLILVGLGAPRQEKWVHQYADSFDKGVFFGCGGSMDGMAGVVKRAPKLFIKLNLEWFYRLMKQPSRFKRMLRLPLFLVKMLFEGRKYQ